MLQNIGQVVSNETNGSVEHVRGTTGAPYVASGKSASLWSPTVDRATIYPRQAAGADPKVFRASDSAREHALLQVNHQNGLPYSWANEFPITPAPEATRFVSLAIKRLMDITLAVLLIVFFLPVFIAAALAIKLTSKGPVLFKQQRVGFRNQDFSVYKFRTMYVASQDLSGVQQTTADDARITAVGRVLRKTSVDELPQIINILKGEMSFVGPRPHVARMLAGGLPYEELVPYYNLRHEMKPGLTGWAQANGFRGPTIDPVRARQRVDHDIAYIQNFSLWLDVVILVRTAWREFVTGTGV